MFHGRFQRRLRPPPRSRSGLELPSEAKISGRRRTAFGQITCVNINRTTTTSGTPSNQSMIGISTSMLLIRHHRPVEQLVRGSEVPGLGLHERDAIPDLAGTGLL
jgi:hypothetical protein